MKTPTIVSALATLAIASLPLTEARRGFHEPLNNHNNFIVAHGWGPERWGCAFTRTQVHETGAGTQITIGKDSDLKPYSCGELIYREEGLGYGFYSIDMIASNVVGQVTSFFLIANGDTEIDIELTGLNNKVGWMNIWHDRKQNPVVIGLPFDASQDWHNYQFEWREDYIAWSVDGKVVLNRTDIPTTPPHKANYKLAINSWTQVQKEEKIAWAGKFEYPTDGKIPQAQFRNMKFLPATATQSAKEMEMRAGGKAESGNRTRVAFEDDGQDVDNMSEGPAKKQVKAPLGEEPKKKKSAAKKTSESNGALASLAFTFAAAVAFI
ncbi:endo-1,3-1,4-beta-glycanase ExoK [Entomortierella parvispora]|uniref:Endo-1,3-1,4-beta-glycanase ExoK n=1 Tax=Entomortierella parvispora TaxID=205924 RepID=A0A9P3HMM9_9FUNG|nr:endo-1,3-1,4-beta-glycanase ExoK [Entomortierella parvispora]